MCSASNSGTSNKKNLWIMHSESPIRNRRNNRGEHPIRDAEQTIHDRQPAQNRSGHLFHADPRKRCERHFSVYDRGAMEQIVLDQHSPIQVGPIDQRR